MVSALLNDALSDPCSVILSLHNEHTSSSSPLHFSTRVAQHFRAIFKHDDAFSQIPAVNAAPIPEYLTRRRLVRFRAMVQDTSASPEVYPSLLRNGNPGGWGLADADPGTNVDDALDLIQHLHEREIVWAISVPGESPFVAKLLDDANTDDDVPSSSGQSTTGRLLHKDPLMRVDHVGVQIKIYDSTSVPLKPTELHTFVGILTLEHLSSGEDSMAPDNMQVLTLHTVFSVKHDPTLVPLKYFPPNRPLSPDHVQIQSHPDPPAALITDELVQWISDAALGGDCDAALWVILVAVARVQSRQPSLFPPSLTLSGFPRPDRDGADGSVPPTPALAHVLRALLPLFVNVPLTLPLINTRLFAPESRDESLHAGLLQLPAGTTVLLSDNGVQEGKITEVGIKNIQALRTAFTMQTIDYRFPFTTPYQFPTDLSFILLTEGKKSAFVETLVNVPMQCTNPQNCYQRPEDIREPPADRMDAFRRFLGSAKAGEVEITDEVSKHIQDDFVRERQQDKTVTPEDLMTRMSIARLLALLLHSPVLTIEIWQEAKQLDQRRKKRL